MARWDPHGAHVEEDDEDKDEVVGGGGLVDSMPCRGFLGCGQCCACAYICVRTGEGVSRDGLMSMQTVSGRYITG